jgi:carboxymethylenebutenolidase
MCDKDTFQDAIEYELRSGAVSRRRFGAIAVGAGLASMLPRAADAAEVSEADAHFVHPLKGKAPAVLVWPDIFGLRPAFRQMGKRMAESGYAVLTVNPFYRIKKAPTSAEGADFQDPATRDALMALAGSLTQDTERTDSQTFVSWLDAQSSVDTKRKIGTTGYCMGGPITMRTAGFNSDRVGAGASFHGGGLVTDKPDSPHLLIPKMKAQYLIAIAENDDQRQPEVKTALREAFAKAKLAAEIEVYAGTMHGWCPIDSHVYNHDQAEKAWSRMLALFSKALV